MREDFSTTELPNNVKAQPIEPSERFNIAQHLLSINAGRPSKLAFIDDEGGISYQTLTNRAHSLSKACASLGLRREERVMILMHDCLDWPAVFLGTIHAGLVPVAVNTLLTAQDYAYMISHCRAQAVFVSAALLPALQAAFDKAQAETGHEVHKVLVAGSFENASFKNAGFTATTSSEVSSSPAIEIQALRPLLEASVVNTNSVSFSGAPTGRDDPAFWLYSSGSTGRPKGTVHSHANAYWTAALYGEPVLGLKESDICFSAAKLFFAYGLGNALTFPMSVGATTVLMAERPTPDAVFKRWRGEFEGHSNSLLPTVFFGAPTGFAGMLAAANLPSQAQVKLRLASSAGEALPEELGKRFSAHFGIEVIDGIGSTEMLHVYLSNVPGKVRYGTTGYPVPGYEIELRDDCGLPVADGETGELFVKGPSAALMYWSNRLKSRETFQGAWTKSGDKYVRNDDGTYTYSGRSDDMLKVSGIYVSPFEVEATLVQHSAVLEAAVIGIQDTEGLTKAKAFVVLKQDQKIDAATLMEFVKARLAPYKYPRIIKFVDELPKTATGKIQRFKLRELSGEKAAASDKVKT